MLRRVCGDSPGLVKLAVVVTRVRTGTANRAGKRSNWYDDIKCDGVCV